MRERGAGNPISKWIEMSRLIVFDSALRILALARKELLAILKDPRSCAKPAPPAEFSSASSTDTQRLTILNNVPYAVLDQDHSPASRDLMARLDGSTEHSCASGWTVAGFGDVKDYIERQRCVVLVIQIGPDFERQRLPAAPLICR